MQVKRADQVLAGEVIRTDHSGDRKVINPIIHVTNPAHVDIILESATGNEFHQLYGVAELIEVVG